MAHCQVPCRFARVSIQSSVGRAGGVVRPDSREFRGTSAEGLYSVAAQANAVRLRLSVLCSSAATSRCPRALRWPCLRSRITLCFQPTRAGKSRLLVQTLQRGIRRKSLFHVPGFVDTRGILTLYNFYGCKIAPSSTAAVWLPTRRRSPSILPRQAVRRTALGLRRAFLNPPPERRPATQTASLRPTTPGFLAQPNAPGQWVPTDQPHPDPSEPWGGSTRPGRVLRDTLIPGMLARLGRVAHHPGWTGPYLEAGSL